MLPPNILQINSKVIDSIASPKVAGTIAFVLFVCHRLQKNGHPLNIVNNVHCTLLLFTVLHEKAVGV